MKKIILAIIGGFLGIGALLPIIYETSDWGINFLNHSTGFGRLFGLPGIIALVSAIIAGGLIGGWKDYTNFHWSETVQAETRYNPAYGILIVSIIIHTFWIFLLE